MPRPTKLTPERQTKIVQAILAGNYFDTACAYAGLGASTVREWLRRGENRDGRRPADRRFAAFAAAVRGAEAQAEVAAVALIRQQMPENPWLALSFLARRYP